MTEQQGNPKRTVALAIVLFIVAVGAFGAAFYLFDGYALVQEMVGGETVEAVDGPGNAAETTSQVATDTLTLPEGMSEEFALRLWQEQVDSQENIQKLFQGEIEQFEITGTTQNGDEAVLDIVADFSDGTSAPGRMLMRRFGTVWYFAYVSGLRERDTGGSADTVGSGGAEPSTPLPRIEDVNIEILNTMLAEQARSASVTEEYASGNVVAVRVADTESGPQTATLRIEMTELDETATGSVIALQDQADGKEMWFIARFTRDDPSGS
jgi:hypothetical protein